MKQNHVTNTLLSIEESARKFFERFPFSHAFIAGVGVILFWRGVWEIADIIKLDPIASVLLGIILLGGIGLFIQTFVGNAIIIKNVKKEEQLEKQTERKVEQVEQEISTEEVNISKLTEKIDELSKKIDLLSKTN